ncbi:Dabb family protein [Planktotalea sp.]|uniref:Dabb family protein n=1 Tax=Planktotalea sp. TaxID=2029877 RepID=UPI003F6CAD75
MILHSVYCNLRSGVQSNAVTAVFQELDTLCKRIDGVLSFEHGPNRDFEAKSPQFAVGFVIRFTDRHALEQYAEHPIHKELGAQLCTLCVGGADGIMVFDLEVEAAQANA